MEIIVRIPIQFNNLEAFTRSSFCFLIIKAVASITSQIGPLFVFCVFRPFRLQSNKFLSNKLEKLKI